MYHKQVLYCIVPPGAPNISSVIGTVYLIAFPNKSREYNCPVLRLRDKNYVPDPTMDLNRQFMYEGKLIINMLFCTKKLLGGAVPKVRFLPKKLISQTAVMIC